MQIPTLILAILFVVFTAIKPIRIGKYKIGMVIGSLLALSVLFAFQIITPRIAIEGIIGNGQLKPWEILIIFFTIAYASISTDITGMFDYLAYKIVHHTRGNGVRLFLFFYLFASILTVFTSNDIVILTLTPIIFYLGKHAKLNVIPLLFAEFFGANTLSMLLYIGNPTNIIVGNALGLGFFEYTQVMWFPTLIAAIANYFLLKRIFKKQITKEFKMNKSSHFNVRNWTDAIISFTTMTLMFICLTLSQPLHLEIWQITLFFASILVIEDIIFSMYYTYKAKGLSPVQLAKRRDVLGIPEEKNEFFMAVKRVPWKILPFIVCFFIIVHALDIYGSLDWIATWIASLSTSLASGIAVMGILGAFLANIINNQPMTILLTSVLMSDAYAVSDIVFKGSAYALVIASNLAANITLLGALAGLMWNKILSTKGVKISYMDFFKKGILITPIVFILTLISLFITLQ